MAKPGPSRRPARRISASTRRAVAARMVFDRRNYVLLLGAVGLIVLGYVLMIVDNARGIDAATNMHHSLDSALSLVVAPLLLLGGYLGVIYAILWRPRPDGEPVAQEVGEAA